MNECLGSPEIPGLLSKITTKRESGKKPNTQRTKKSERMAQSQQSIAVSSKHIGAISQSWAATQFVCDETTIFFATKRENCVSFWVSDR